MSPQPKDIVRLSGARVLVVGDVMVDHYVSGRVSRVSDEAPVPIIRVDSERWTPGGAANVAANIASLGGRSAIVGAVGEDSVAETLKRLLSAYGPALDLRLVVEPGRPTTQKTRYMGGQHQIVRVDREDAAPVSQATAAALVAAAAELAAQTRVTVLSDYAKGGLTDEVIRGVIDASRAAGRPVLVDPKRNDWSIYRGADYITPNRKELTAATGLPCGNDAECALAADAAMAKTGAAILLTRSEKGVSLYRPGQVAVHLPAKAREVFDVSGAGDTIVAGVALGLAAGLSIEMALWIGNLAAGVVVSKRGTATVTAEELIAELGGHGFADEPDAASSPALSLADAKALRQAWGREGLSVGFTNGCFDLLHPGHISLLRQAAAACDRLIVALNTDESVRRLKGPSRPVQTEGARAAVMSAIKGVDAVILFGEDTPLEAIRELEPDVLVKGADYQESEIVGADIVLARGGRVVRAQLVEGQSTTRMVAKSAQSGG